MAKTATVFTRVEPEVKKRAEDVLDKLGISMSTALEMYLRQIAMQRKIPFEVGLPSDHPIVYNQLSDDQFNSCMEDAFASYSQGKCVRAEDAMAELKAQLKL